MTLGFFFHRGGGKPRGQDGSSMPPKEEAALLRERLPLKLCVVSLEVDQRTELHVLEVIQVDTAVVPEPFVTVLSTTPSMSISFR